MKKIILLVFAVALLASCGVSTSTPEKDGKKIGREYNQAKSPNDILEADKLLEKYVKAYEKEVLSGKRDIEDLQNLYDYVGKNM